MAAGAFFALTLAGASAFAEETAPVPPSNSSSGTQHEHHHKNSATEQNAGCQHILAECEKLGFIKGQWKKDNGLYKDCFDPVVKGGTPTRDGQPISVPVSAADVQSCQAAHEAHHKNKSETGKGTGIGR